MGYNTYRLEEGQTATAAGASISIEKDGTYNLETDLYSMMMDPASGGTIKSLRVKNLGNWECVDTANARRFSELRGYFYEDGQFHSSADQPAKMTILENGPLEICLRVDGFIGIHPFKQTVTLAEGRRTIDFNLRIDWQGNPGIGASYAQKGGWLTQDHHKAFYDNRYKLLALFPLNLEKQKICKNAAFDVTESKLADTFFDRWDSIKNDIILNWVDATDDANRRGLALLTDHTTSYAHGPDFPLGLTVQYSGIGLWGKNYSITGPTEVNYALVPHGGKWDMAGIWTESDRWNEPLTTTVMSSDFGSATAQKSLVNVSGAGWEVSSLRRDGNDLLVRVFNAEGDGSPKEIVFDGHADRVETVELSGQAIRDLPQTRLAGKTTVRLSVPRFKVQTIRLDGYSGGPL